MIVILKRGRYVILAIASTDDMAMVLGNVKSFRSSWQEAADLVLDGKAVLPFQFRSSFSSPKYSSLEANLPLKSFSNKVHCNKFDGCIYCSFTLNGLTKFVIII